jgi:hypothetical protein
MVWAAMKKLLRQCVCGRMVGCKRRLLHDYFDVVDEEYYSITCECGRNIPDQCYAVTAWKKWRKMQQRDRMFIAREEVRKADYKARMGREME